MAMAMKMRDYLQRQDVDFEEVTHPKEVSANRIAQQAHISGDRVAKSVLIKGDSGYRIVVIPSTCKADLNGLSHHLRERLGLATEQEMQALFADCDTGALPPFGQAYGVRVICDDSLMLQPDVYLEAGDHETLVRMSRDEFQRLMLQAEHGDFCRHI